MARDVWLEVALNGPWSRATQPRIPIAVEEIVAEGIACANAGASIIHVHAYDVATGKQKDDPDIYSAIIEGIRERVDAIVYPTIPFAGSRDAVVASAPAARFAAVESLAKHGLIEWAVVDPGSLDVAHRRDVAAGRSGFVYLNPEEEVRFGLSLAREYGFHPSYAIYEPGFLRLGAALAAQYPGVPEPIYRFMFSNDFLFSFPPKRYGLDAYLALLAEVTPGAPWMVAGLAVEIAPLVPEVVARGGHVRVGLEDAPFQSALSNIELVESAARLIAASGGRLARATDVRATLSGPKI